MTSQGQATGLRPVPTGYVVSAAFAKAGMVFLAIGVGSTLALQRGDDPLDAIDSWGLVALLAVFVSAYVMRLIFWRRVPEERQATVRAFFVGLFCCELAACVAAVWFQATVLKGPHNRSQTGLPIAAMVAASLFQIATAIWLLRYRRK